MSLRIDLLNETERRYQGAVSHRFIAQIVLTVGGVICLIIIALTFLHVRNINQNLKWRQEEWAEIEPAYENVRTMEASLQSNEKLYAELKAWGVSRLEWHKLLADLRAVVPANIQFSRLDIKGTMNIPSDPKTGNRSRSYLIRLDGRATGFRADGTVVQFLRTLRQDPSYEAVLESAKLHNMNKDSSDVNDPDARVFTIEAQTIPLEMKWTREH